MTGRVGVYNKCDTNAPSWGLAWLMGLINPPLFAPTDTNPASRHEGAFVLFTPIPDLESRKEHADVF